MTDTSNNRKPQVLIKLCPVCKDSYMRQTFELESIKITSFDSRYNEDIPVSSTAVLKCPSCGYVNG